ncbi:MAG: leucine-rich repeat protein [Clostridia bacterium]|nr:leucine-rich repeat protein [Clostridia bacterium]
MSRKIGKISTIFALLVLLCVSIFTLSACGDNDDEHIHIPNSAVRENETAVTCASAGSYDEVIYCAECSEEISRTTKTIEKLSHASSNWITDKDATCKEAGSKHKECTECEAVLETTSIDKLTTHTPAEAKTENFVDSTCKVEGSYDEVINCSVCGVEISRTEKTVEKKTTHTPSEAKIENFVDSTCKAEGSYDEVIYCSVCGVEISRSEKTVEKKTTHTPGEAKTENFVDSTCKAEGSYDEVVYCSVCGVEISRTAKTVEKKTTHTLAEAKTENFVDSTCKAEGSYDEVVYCSICGIEISRTEKTVAKKTNHTPAEAVVENSVAPDCVNRGSYDSVVYCSVCEKEISRVRVTVDALGHAHNSVVTVPTCTEKGFTTHTCHCGDSYIDTYIDELGHKYNDGVITTTPTCTEKGVKTFTCATCGDSYTEEVAALGHSHNSVVTAPTCTEKGFTTHTCHCGDTYVGTYTDAKGHTKVIDTPRAPTCTKAGLTEGSHCSVCDTVLVKQEIVPTKGHTEVADAAVAPTCTEAGLTAGKHCSVCNTVITAQEIVAALGHTEVVDEAKSPTCTETGLTEGKHCSVCNTTLIAQEVVKANGHTEGKWIIDVEPTIYESGLKHKGCEICQEVLEVDVVEILASYTVTFKQNNEEDIIIRVITNGALTDIPTPQERIGYTVKWNITDFSKITDNLVVSAVETPITYTVNYVLSYGNVPIENPKTYTVKTELTALSNPQSSFGITFAGWFTSPDFTTTTAITHIGGGMIGDITVYGQFVFYRVESVTGFEIDYSAGAPQIMATVSNETFEIDMKPLVEVSSGCTYKIYEDKYGKFSYDFGILPLDVGDNVFYLSVYHPNSSVYYTLYELHIYRLDIKEYAFMNDGVVWESGEIEESSSLEAPEAPQKAGYTFDGWTVDGEFVSFPYAVNGDTVFVAKYTPIIYNITYELNGGTLETDKNSYTIEETLTFDKPNRYAYSFEGWYLDKECTLDYNKIVIGTYGDIKVYAKWLPIVCDIIYNLDSGTNGEGNPANYTVESEDITLAEPTKIGYTFTGWTYDGQKVPTKTVTISKGSYGKKEFTANWKANNYTVTFLTEDGEPTYEPLTVTYDSPFTLPESQREYYQLIWINGGTEFVNDIWNIAGDVTLTAKYISIFTVSGNAIMGMTDYGIENYTEIVIPEKIDGVGITEIGANAFKNCSNLVSATIPDNITSIGSYAFYGCAGLEKIHFNATAMKDLSSGNYVFYNAGANGNGIKVVIGKNVTKIPAYLFCHYSSSYSPKITSVEFEEGSVCESIGKYAFYGCVNLTSVTIPDGVTNISDYAFYYCSSLTSVTIPYSVISIGNYAFYRCINITNILIGHGVESIGAGAFSGCTSLMSVVIGFEVSDIGANAFESCYKLVEVINCSGLNISTGSTGYGYVAYHAIEVHIESTKIVNKEGYLFYTYNGTNYLIGYTGSERDLILPENYNDEDYKIYKYAFYECDDITSIIIPDSITSIGSSAFFGCTSLRSVTIGNSVTSIGSSAFENCVALTGVTIGNGVKSIGYSAFSGCRSLTSVTIPDSVTSIGSSAFEYCTSLTSVKLGMGVTAIGDRAFQYCYSLTSIVISNNVTIIYEWAFDDCYTLTSVYYYGIESEWSSITIRSGNMDLTGATRYHYSENEPALNADGTAYDGNYWYYDVLSGNIVEWVYTPEE